jgi:hypothetical protein
MMAFVCVILSIVCALAALVRMQDDNYMGAAFAFLGFAAYAYVAVNV